MYTVGYLFYYGCALISRSYTVFAVSLFAHACQMAFLELVENPHIAKIYGDVVEDETKSKREEIIYDANKGYFRKDLVVLHNFNPFRAVDIITIILIAQTVVLNFVTLPEWYHVATAVLWRVAHTGGLGLVLHLQSKHQFWTKGAAKRGMNKQVKRKVKEASIVLWGNEERL